jgi:PAS domain S-box-containing protein
MTLAAAIALLLLAALGLLTLAQLVADRGGPAGRWLRPVASATLRGGLTRSLFALAVIPALALTLLAADRQARDYAARDEALVGETAANVAGQVDGFVARHSAGVRGAAEAIALDGALDPARLEQWLLRYHPIHRDFRTMLVAGPDGQILARSVRRGGAVEVGPRVARGVADRDYFQRPIATGADFVSDGFRGRGLGSDPLIAVSSAIVVDGRRWGVVEGSMDLAAFQRLDASLERLSGAHLLLLDSRGAVLHADAALGVDLLEPLSATPLAAAFDDVPPAEVRLADRNLLVGRARTALGWHVLIVKPVRTSWALLADVRWLFAAWLGLCALAAGALAWALARRVDGPLARARDLEAELREVVKEREREIADATGQLAQANAELEKRNRTLQLSEEHFRALAGLATVGIVVVDASGRCIYVNAEWCRIAGLPTAATAGRGWCIGLDAVDVAQLLRPLDPAVGADASAKGESALLRMRRPDGEVRWLQARATAIRTELSVETCVLATFEDVTELVASRQQIRNLAQRLETAKEEERLAIAQRLHEGIAQDLYGAKLSLEQLRRMPPGAPGVEEFEREIEGMLVGVLASLRDVTNDLRPTGLENLSLPELLQWHADRFAARTGLAVAVGEQLVGRRRAPATGPDARLALFRAVQEALANVVAHARATRVRIDVRWLADEVVVEVVDDGTGTVPGDESKSDSFGLLRLRERFARLGGSVALATVPGEGTIFTARLPLDATLPVRALAGGRALR